jgi:hypothetical protein
MRQKKRSTEFYSNTRYLILVNDEILQAFPSGTLPSVEKTTLRSNEEMEPYLREPFEPGLESVYQIPRIGQ